MKSVIERVKCALYESPRVWFVGVLPCTDHECRIIRKTLKLIKLIEISRSKELLNKEWSGWQLTGSEIVRRQNRRQEVARLCGVRLSDTDFVFGKDGYRNLEDILIETIMKIVDLNRGFNSPCSKEIREAIDRLAKREVHYMWETMRTIELGWHGMKCVLMLVFISLFAYSAWINSDLIRYISYGWVAVATFFLGFYKSCAADVWKTILKIAREDFSDKSEIINFDLYRRREAESLKALLGSSGEKRAVAAL